MRAAVVVGTLGATLLTACGKEEPAMPFEKCYDTLPSPTAAQAVAEPLTLHYNPSKRRFNEEVAPQKLDMLTAASFAVYAPSFKGSGFVTRAPDGSNVGVVAAHTLQDLSLEDITLVSAKGAQASVADGCYMYKSGTEDGLRYIDIAVLRLSGSLGGSAVQLAAEPPRRGEWVTVVNHQNAIVHNTYSPAVFGGIVARWRQNTYDNVVITGLQPYMNTNSDKEMYTLQPGGSGGIVGNGTTGEVYGMVVAGNNHHQTTEELAKQFALRCNCTTGYDTGILPTPAYNVGSPAIMYALRSARY